MQWRVVFSSSSDLSRARAQIPSSGAGPFAWLDEAAQAFLATLFPADCRLCRQPLTRLSRLPVCDPCLASIRPTGCRTCTICGERLESEFAEGICGMCRRVEPQFAKASAYGGYEGALRELIHLLKYDHVRPAARVLGRLLAQVLDDLQPAFADRLPLVVPVPLHAGRLRERGFNQSEELARAALKLRPGFEMSTRVLVRRRATASQIGLTRHQRRANLRGAFAVVAAEQIAARDVILVDDVFTTGTTVSECARILRRSGASRVFIATVARVLKSEPQAAASNNLHREEEAALAATA